MYAEELIQQYTEGRRNFSGIALPYSYINYFNLSGINLSKACLVYSYFLESNLSGANLTYANLTYSCLLFANFTNSNLTNAILIESELSGANFTDANLQGTCLDPKAIVPKTDLSELETDGDYVIGYRTKRSTHCANIIYEPGSHHVAPWFSVCTETTCHPGIYLAPFTWIKRKYSQHLHVKVKALKSETLKVGDKYRAKQIWVLEDV